MTSHHAFFLLCYFVGLLFFGCIVLIIVAVRTIHHLTSPILLFIGYRFYAFGTHVFRPSYRNLHRRAGS